MPRVDSMPTEAPAAVLLVEDEPTIAITLRDELEDHGYRVVCIGSGDGAIGLLQGGVYAAVVTDLRLPGASGTAVVTAAKQRRQSLPVLVITAWVDGSAADLWRAGADGVLAKPFANQQVVDWLRLQSVLPGAA
jgi:DNA-binding response OmpR family regulator